MIGKPDLLSLFLLSPLLPHNIIPQRVGQLHRFAVAQTAALELAGQVGDAAAPAVLVRKIVHHLAHGHARPDDYFSRVLSDDLTAILKDIREAHTQDATTADDISVAAEVGKPVQDAMNYEGSKQEKQARVC